MTLFCQVRKIPVVNSPEEQVRQSLLKQMFFTGGYPLSLVAVEKSLASMPHIIPSTKLPQRRADIIVYAGGIHPEHALFPLMLIECKATALNAAVVRQVVGYNQLVCAKFLVIANIHQIQTGILTEEGWVFKEGMPPYEEALGALKK
jgi:hypothetical protein